MADGLNKVMLIGNLGANPDLKYTQGNHAVLRIRLATTESYVKQGSSERQQRTEWHTVVVWGRRAEALGKILEKGRTIYVEGRIQSRQWEDQNGNKRSAVDIVANEILLLGGSRRGSGEDREADPDDRPAPRGGAPSHRGGRAAREPDYGSAGGEADYGGDEDIPF